MVFKKGYWDQIYIVRNRMRDFFKDRIKQARVVSTHVSKSIQLPVMMVQLTDGTIFIIRSNFYDWKVTVVSPTAIILNTSIFTCNEQVDPIYCEGFNKDWVLGPYSQNNKEFTIELYDDQQFVYPMIALLVAALEKTTIDLQNTVSYRNENHLDHLAEAYQLLHKFDR